ncbi:hypothetical protein MEQU1_001932 [Malassezia equina]|uniref:Transmembrane protein n=1 Tax=Malassezia equina TaxID=1381935 RepID=A0AAF0J088_9BASI|nr:hypothetical protein MEQU1_001932 [Malassezia equina]
MDSYYVMLPSELREALLRHPALKNSTQWTMAILATATVVTSAMAFYYYAQYNGYETNISQLISFLNKHEFGWLLSPSMFQEDDGTDEEPCDDDDEHVDADLMDGFEKSMRSGSLNVRLVSADPTSELSYAPFQLDLCRGKTSRVPSQDLSYSPEPSESMASSPPLGPSILRRESQTFPSQLLCDPRALYELPRHRRRMARHLIHDPWESLSPPPLALKDYFTTSESKSGVDADKLLSALKREPTNATCKAMERRVAFKEPDWVPYIDTHGRARQRAVVAILARSLSGPPSGSSTPTTPAEEIGKDILMKTLPTVSPKELGDGAAFWFERFTRATAAGGKHWDFRRRKNEPAEHFNSDVFDELLTPENVRMEDISPLSSPSLSHALLDHT